MIKINLLNSVTERQGGTAMAIDRRVGSPTSRLLLLTLAVGFLLAAVIGWDVISSQMAKTRAEQAKAEQEQIQKELEVVMREQQELEQKIKNIDMRIEAIKNLRAKQAGPSAVLAAMRDRIAMVPGLYLKSIEQSGEQVTIIGNSPDEAAVTQFGRSLEFSNGLFSNLNIETKREEVVNQLASAPAGGGEVPKVNVITFTIKTAYTPSKAPQPGTASTTASAAPNASGAPAIQVAKN